jgi:TolA protein
LQAEQEQKRIQAEKERQARAQAEAQRRRQELDNAIKELEQRQAAMAAEGANARAGGSPEQIDPRLMAYNQRLRDSVQRNWILPEGHNNKGLVVVINFNIRRDGSVERIWIEQSSGNAVFDNSALRAAEKTAPFPPPPSVVRTPILELGIIFSDGSS